MRRYHITYFVSRGDLNASDETLLSGVTVDAQDIQEALTAYKKLQKDDNLPELSEVKYIIEL